MLAKHYLQIFNFYGILHQVNTLIYYCLTIG